MHEHLKLCSHQNETPPPPQKKISHKNHNHNKSCHQISVHAQKYTPTPKMAPQSGNLEIIKIISQVKVMMLQ